MSQEIIPIDYKKEEAFCSLVSQYRTNIDLMNSNLTELAQFHKDLKKNIKIIITNNNKFMKKFVCDDEKNERVLTHEPAIHIIEQYIDNSEINKSLKEMKDLIHKQQDSFLDSPNSPYVLVEGQKFASKQTQLKKNFDKLKDLINAKNKRVCDDYFDDVASILERNMRAFDDDDFDDDEDDKDDDPYSRNNRRYYGNPYPQIPESLRKSIFQFMTYINLDIIFSIVLDFDTYIDNCYSHLEIERPPRALPSETPSGDITIDDSSKQIAALKDEIEKLNCKYKELKNENEKLKDENKVDIKKLKNEIEELKDKNEELKDKNEELKDEIKKLKDANEKLKTASFTKPYELDQNADDKYLSGYSYFRRTIDKMNTELVELKKLISDPNNTYKDIANINNSFIEELVTDTSSDLSHYNRLTNVYNYYLKKNDNQEEQQSICYLLIDSKHTLYEQIKKYDFNKKFNKLADDDEKVKYQEQVQSIVKLFEDVKKEIEEPQSYKSLDTYDEFFENKIDPLFNDNDNDNDDHDGDDDDDDESSINRRFFGNPYPRVPEIFAILVNRFLTYVKSFISISSIIDFDKYIANKLDSKDANMPYINQLNMLYSGIKNSEESKLDLKSTLKMLEYIKKLKSSAKELYNISSKSMENLASFT